MKILCMYSIRICSSLYDGIMIVGKAFSGKTCLYKVLAKALAELPTDEDKPKEDRFVNTVVVNPKSMTINQLFGYFDECAEWKDGILATSLRSFSNMNPPGTLKYYIYIYP